MSSFVTYPANEIQPRRIRRACERCHSRKVRCDIGTGKGPCTNCVTYGDTCMPRQRKRKVTSISATSNSPTNGAEQVQENKIHVANAPSSRDPHATFIVHSYSSRTDPARSTSSSIPYAQGVASSAIAETTSASSYQSSKDECRNASYISRSAILEDIPGLDHANGVAEEREHKLSDTKIKVLQLYHAFDLPPIPVRQSLVEAFFEMCWTWMPVVDPEVLGMATSKPPSLLLLQAIFLAGSQMRKGTSSYASSEDYYTRTKALLDTGLERNPMTVLSALCMIQWWNPSAPTDVSTNTSRFWINYGIGIAQQVGLHRKLLKSTPDAGLRSRIWWTLYARDSLIASAHGRPRIINLEDCNVDPPSIYDFPEPTDLRAQIFVYYVKICGLVCDLCQLLTRNSSPSPEAKDAIGLKLLDWIRTLPSELRLYNSDGSSRPYDFELVQLHVPFFSAICVLFRPRSVFKIGAESAAAVVASTLNFRLFEALHLRDQTFYLGPIYAWHLLVAAIPQLSCSKIPSLWEEAQYSLNTIEDVLRGLGTKWPSATNNLRNVQVLRNALDSAGPTSAARNITSAGNPFAFSFSPFELFETLGPEVLQNFEHIRSLLASNLVGKLQYAFPSNGSETTAYSQSDDKVSSFDGSSMNENEPPFESRIVPPFANDPFDDVSYFSSDWMRTWVDDLGIQ